MSREMWSQLKQYSDGENLDAKTLNGPIGQLGDRTSYLYSRLKSLMSGGKMSAVILADVELATDAYEPDVGNVVYLDNDSGKFAKAQATMSLYDDFTAADSAFTVGILQRKEGGVGDVIAYGSLDLNPGGVQFDKADMIEDGEEFRPGRFYLSANQAGRLTANPSGPRIYVCTISASVGKSGLFDGNAIVSPQFLDLGTSHVHRTAVLTARPAGSLSPAGYLPLSYDSDHPERSLALRFGGTWTGKEPVVYEFVLPSPSATWSGGVTLRWTENGKVTREAQIYAPDEEVQISNGLTARLTMPGASATAAYSNLDEEARKWGALEFPSAGRGWTSHEGFALAAGDVDGFRVAVRGRFDASPLAVNVAFPESAQLVELGAIADGTTFEYGQTTFEFTEDTEAHPDKVPVGTCLADSALFLAEALEKSGEKGRFAVFESYGGAVATLLVMDGDQVDNTQSVVLSVDEERGAAFDVIGATGVKMVVFDGNGRVLGDSAIVTEASSYVWNDIGELSVMMYQTQSAPVVTVPAGTVVSGTATDDEPDAIYDYVIGMDPQIANYWPPVPPKSAALVVNGVEMDNKALLPENPTVSFGRSTIHWFEDDTGRKPWPEAIESRDAPIDPSEDKTEVMHWIRGFQGASGPVTSLQVKAGSPLRIYGYGTEDYSNTGDLEISADFDFSVENGGAPGYNVPKRGRGGKLIAGPVVERIIGGAGINVIKRAGCPQGQGEVVIALEDGSYRSQFADIALENAEQAKIGMFPYIRLKGYTTTISHPSAFTATMRVPSNLPDGKYRLMVYANVFGETGFSEAAQRFACIRFSYNILPDLTAPHDEMYSNLKTSLLVPDVERTVLVPLGHQATDGSGKIVYNGFDPVLVSTNDPGMADKSDVVAKVLGANIPDEQDFILQRLPEPPALRPGYLVGIRMSRAVTQASGKDPYTDALGFINLSWALLSEGEYSAAKSYSKVLDGVEIRANTADGMRDAVETIGGALGATVVGDVRR